MKLIPGLLFILLLVPTVTFATEISIRPFLIDVSMVPRESVGETIVLTNEHVARTATIYTTVNEITVGRDGEIREFVSPVMSNRTNTITSWIDIERGRITIPAGETAEIPLTIKVHPFAEPGEYHAYIGFVEAKKRDDAEQIALAGNAKGMVVKVTITDQRVESMRISSMIIDRLVTDSDNRQVEITIENSGDLDSTPGGEIIFYDNRGFEVSAQQFNPTGQSVAPDQTKTFVATIPLDSQIGRFKANANLHYGANQRASLFDSTGFFMLPIHYLYIGISVLSLLLLILFILMRRGAATVFSSEAGDDVPMFIRDGHKPKPQDHDIDLTK